MKKTFLLLSIIMITLTLFACTNELTIVSNNSSEPSAVEIESSTEVTTETEQSELTDIVSGDLPINNLTAHSILPNFSNTGAKTEDFVIYDGTTKTSLLDGYCDECCKVHNMGYHAYTEYDIYKLGSEENISNYIKRFCLSNTLINGHSPICEGYNQIQMIWDLGITTAQVEELLGSYEEFAEKLRDYDWLTEKDIEMYKTYYMGFESEITDKDIDTIQMAWKNDFCVYTNKSFYTIDWLFEHSAQDYLEQRLPIDQLEEIYSKKNNGCPIVEFLGERIEKYKSITPCVILDPPDYTKKALFFTDVNGKILCFYTTDEDAEKALIKTKDAEGREIGIYITNPNAYRVHVQYIANSISNIKYDEYMSDGTVRYYEVHPDNKDAVVIYTVFAVTDCPESYYDADMFD